jgi:hypothetical protein
MDHQRVLIVQVILAYGAIWIQLDVTASPTNPMKARVEGGPMRCQMLVDKCAQGGVIRNLDALYVFF